jgi:hypothetical protein
VGEDVWLAEVVALDGDADVAKLVDEGVEELAVVLESSVVNALLLAAEAEAAAALAADSADGKMEVTSVNTDTPMETSTSNGLADD